MVEALVITPVKDSLSNTLQTIRSVRESKAPVRHLVFNDFSTQTTKNALDGQKTALGFELFHLEDMTDHPSPNYKLVLIEAQKMALESSLPLIIVESDVEVKPETFKEMLAFYKKHSNIGLLAAVTVDEEDAINFPYLRFKQLRADEGFTDTRKSLSFCCTLVSSRLLRQYDLAQLDSTKHWYDTFLSDQSLKLGLRNVLLTQTRVLHKPHGSRPWKQLKYKNPLKYYLLKLLKNRDKI